MEITKNSIMTTTNTVPPQLNARQKRILRLIGLGMNRKEIARELGVSPTAIYQSIYTISGKIGVDTNQKMALYAVKHGYVKIEEIDIP